MKLLFTIYLVESNSGLFGAESSNGDCDQSRQPSSVSSVTGKWRSFSLSFHTFFNEFPLEISSVRALLKF